MPPCLIACSMQHVLTMSTYPGPYKSCFSHIPVFGRKVFLILPIIYQTVDLKLICIIGQSDLINPLLTFLASFPFSHVSWLLNFIETRSVSFWLILTVLTYKLNLKLLDQSCPKPVFLMTVQEVHKEYNSLTDQIPAKYE